MNRLQDAIGQDFQWVRPRLLKNEYELRANNELFGTFQWDSFRQRASGEVVGERLAIQGKGFTQRKIMASSAETNAETGQMRRTWNGGVLTLANGRQYQWNNISFWKGAWSWLNQDNQAVMTFKPGKQVVLPVEASHAEEDLPILMLLGWYMMLLQESETAATVATIASM